MATPSPFTIQNVETIQMTGTVGTVTGASITALTGGVSVGGYFAASGGVSAGTLQISSQNINDSTGGKITFGNTFGTAGVSTTGTSIIIGTGPNYLELYQGTITDTSGTIDFNSTNLTTNGTGTFGGTLLLDGATISDTGPTDIAITPGVLTDKLDAHTGTIDIGGTALVTFANGSYQFPTGTPTTGQTFVAGAGGILTFGTAGGGSGASTINGLADAKADTTNVILGNDAPTLGGTNNVAVGVSALFDIGTGSGNVAIGFNALENNTGSNNNVAIGMSAFSLYDVVGDGFNTVVGYNSGSGVSTNGVSGLTIIGASSGVTLTEESNNLTLIGYQVEPVIGDTSNAVYIGNPQVQNVYIQGSQFLTSDGRDKTDVEDSTYGLNIVDNLRPVEFTWDRRPILPGDTKNATNGQRSVGLIAQEVRDSLTEEENKILNLVNDSSEERFHMCYNNLIPILVKAVKDLKAEVDTLKQRMDNCSC